MSDDIRVEDTGPVRVIRFDRVAKKNAITRAMYSAMAKIGVIPMPAANNSVF